MSDIQTLKQLVNSTPSRSIESFSHIFNEFMLTQTLEVQASQEQKAIIADTLIWYMGGVHKLEFDYPEAYLILGIPRKFLREHS